VRFTVLALDYDGTIARDGALDPEVRRALADVRGRGVTVLLVTGRILSDLRRVAGDLRFVDGVVAENGAVMAFPDSGRSAVLAAPPPKALVEELRARKVRIEVGECIVEAAAASAPVVLEVIQRLEQPYVLVFNRDRMMVLPTGINKASGLREALRALRLSPHNAIAIGDAENDHDLLEVCELGVAVAWGSAALKRKADEILEGSGPPAVAPYIRAVAETSRLAPDRIGRRRVLLGRSADDGQPFSLAVRGRNVLVVGDPKSGKSWVAGLLCEQLVLHRYSVCVIDPEGDYAGLEALPGVIVLGGTHEGPTPYELHSALKFPDVNVVLDLSHMPHARKLAYIRALLGGLMDLRARYGVPHRILLDEAHHFLHEADIAEFLDLELAGYTLVTYQPSRLHPAVLAASEAVVVTRLTDVRERQALAAWCSQPEACLRALDRLEVGEAAILPATEEASGFVRRVRLIPRLTPHVRHREKYLDVPVPGDRAFVFEPGARSPERAHTLREFAAGVTARPVEELDGHLSRGDFSRWLGDVFGDHALAAELKRLEEQHRLGTVADVNDAIVGAILRRYELEEE
jgi:hydroxymethylpyrimidine pyrophosphatase-like HAD family hydrolase